VAHRTGQDTDGIPDFPFARPDAVAPPPEWDRLREECPIADIRLVSGDRALLLTRIEDVRQLLKDPRFGRQLDPAKGAARLSTADDPETMEVLRGSVGDTGSNTKRKFGLLR
jgi:cytochrome P450